MGNNLGGYIKIVKAAKSMGGPGYLLIGVAVVGYGVVRLSEVGVRAGVKNGAKVFRKWTQGPPLESLPIYYATMSADVGGGVVLAGGDQFRVLVLEASADMALIEFPLDSDTGHTVSAKKLSDASTFSLDDEVG
ncbi:hypothetical protein [Frigoribacterium sp. SL97]|uniref:hypothetical protein n=1 Tax=Frigoribacterium sp. SL97 TaxID=2994664 RepID=UPI00226E8183|nr:hypothetical protein [Frigoribacterium sp. SL97]WAC52177.1 hypothetical protein OVA02_02565 [Frigoribacterium sp. SL97]